MELIEGSARRPPKTPSGLPPVGRRLWRSVVADYELNPAELAMLAQACRVAGRVADLEAILADTPVMVEGSKGQPVVNPLGRELREERLLLARLVDAAGIPADSSPWDRLTASERARKAAQIRWTPGARRRGA